MPLKKIFCFLIAIHVSLFSFSKTINVGSSYEYNSIKIALGFCENGDTLLVHGGIYKEGNIVVNKEIIFLGKNLPVLDGQKKYEVLSIKCSNVVVEGFKVQSSGYGTLDDPCAIKVYDSRNVIIRNNVLYDNFFGIYLQYSQKCGRGSGSLE